jgi:hypothetical protein
MQEPLHSTPDRHRPLSSPEPPPQSSLEPELEPEELELPLDPEPELLKVESTEASGPPASGKGTHPMEPPPSGERSFWQIWPLGHPDAAMQMPRLSQNEPVGQGSPLPQPSTHEWR